MASWGFSWLFLSQENKQQNKTNPQRCTCAQDALLVSHMAAAAAYTVPCFLDFVSSLSKAAMNGQQSVGAQKMTPCINLTRQRGSHKNVLAVYDLLKGPAYTSLVPKYKKPFQANGIWYNF